MLTPSSPLGGDEGIMFLQTVAIYLRHPCGVTSHNTNTDNKLTISNKLTAICSRNLTFFCTEK
jgi:hypothetical protein